MGSEFEVNSLKVCKKKWIKKRMIVSLFLFFLIFPAVKGSAATNDSLYTQIDENGNYIDGNKTPIKYDKPVIRPSYVGTSILDDYIGPNGKFQGFWGEKPSSGSTDDYWGQEYSINKGTVIKNVGYYNGKSLALKVSFTNKLSHWMQKVTLTRDGGLNVSPDTYGIEFRLVYNDGLFNTPVEGVYVELPVLSTPTSKNNSFNYYSQTSIKQSNLVRMIFNEEIPRIITNEVIRESYSFKNSSGNDYKTDALTILHKFDGIGNKYTREVKQTFIFDNKEPLLVAESMSLNYSIVTTLFKSSMKTPGEISYLPPRTNGSQNTSKFEANFDITQTINDGYEQYFPDSLSLVMLDDLNLFESLHLSRIEFKDQNDKDISSYIEKIPINDHQLEFKIKKTDLIKLGSNQINVTISADNLDSEAVLKRYDKAKNIYTVPVKFYNYKMVAGKKIESDKMTATAEITPNIYGEAADEVKADQYTYSGDLEIDTLLKNVTTTIPSDSLKTEIVDKSIYFNTVKTYNVDVKISSTTTSNTKVVSVPVNIIKATPVTSAYFENQAWLINEINSQFVSKNKKIDENLYMRDLLEVTAITNRAGPDFAGQHIPKTIEALKNLQVIDLKDKKLIGDLPNELGNLTELTKLSIFGNSFSGGIPKSIVDLTNLTFLALDDNDLTGTVPLGLEKLPKLKQVYLNKNKLVGNLPHFDLGPFSNFNISETQLTYNDQIGPSFIVKPAHYAETFVSGMKSLSLAGVMNLPITTDGTKIKPFDSTDEGFLDLHARKSDLSRIELYPGHLFKIINKKNGNILYDGSATKEVEITIDSDENYQVIMDNAEKNSNNVIEFETKLREYKLSGVPKNLSLDLKLGDLAYQPVKIASEDSLSIFDNRLNSQWQIKVKASELKSKTRTMSGNFYYKAVTGLLIVIPSDDSFKTIASGKSEPVNGMIDVSKDWNDEYGLFYKQENTGNYKDSYTGKLEWQLVDAPTGG